MKTPIPITADIPITAAATAIPAIAPVDKECVLEFGEIVCPSLPAVEEEVEMAPVAVAEVPC